MVVVLKFWHIFIRKMSKNLILSEENTCSTGEEHGKNQFQIETTGTELMFIGSALQSNYMKNYSGVLYWFAVCKIKNGIIL